MNRVDGGFYATRAATMEVQIMENELVRTDNILWEVSSLTVCVYWWDFAPIYVGWESTQKQREETERKKKHK